MLNAAKSKFMLLFRSPKIIPSISLKINGKSIEQVKGILHPELPDSIYFNIKIFLQFKFQICAYTQLKSKKKK